MSTPGSKSHSIAVIGGGVTGLSCAWHLKRLSEARGIRACVTVFETADRAGGKIQTRLRDGYQIETSANGFLGTKPSTLQLSAELGLGDQLVTASTNAANRYLLLRDKLHKLPAGPLSLLASPVLSFSGKLRLLSEMWRQAGDGQDETIHQFAVRRFGRETADVLVDAMIAGIHASDPRLLSLRATFPRMIELEQKYGSILRAMPKVAAERKLQPMPDRIPKVEKPAGLWSFQNGMGQLVDRLSERVEPRLNSQAQSVLRTAEGWQIQFAKHEPQCCDRLILATPAFVQADLLSETATKLAEELRQIQYNSISVVALAFEQSQLKRSLNGFGYLSPQSARRNVLGVLWSSSVYQRRAPSGRVLIRAMCGGLNRPDLIDWEDQRLVDAVVTELRMTLGLSGQPQFSEVYRWRQAIPQYFEDHLSRLDKIELLRKEQPSLYLTGNAFRGVAVNDCTAEALRCAQEVIDELASGD